MPEYSLRITTYEIMKLIEVKNLSKSYTTGKITTPALKSIDLVVNKGDFICIAGPSGSGKTTLLNLIGALDKPTNGSILYQGKDITTLNLHQLSEFRLHKIGFIFQAYNLIPTLTALENAEYVGLIQGLEGRARRKQAEALLKEIGLQDCLHKKTNNLSGGQQQRVAIARAILTHPEAVLADEPTANLDSKNSSGLLDLMQRLNQEKQITFIFSSHDPLVMEKAHKVHHLKDGKIIN